LELLNSKLQKKLNYKLIFFFYSFLRNYLISINFNRQPPPPKLPEEIIEKTSQKYLEIYEIITGEKLKL